MKLTRFGAIPGIGTFGQLDIGVYKFFTVEREWADNKPFVSCIPAGEYELEEHSSTQYPNTYALIGETVSHYSSDKARSVCLFHAANWPDEVQGCIGIGKILTYINGNLGVTNSKESMEIFRFYMSEHKDQERLIITDKVINYV